MLTVKHIHLDGCEVIHQAHEVSFTPTPTEQRAKTRSPIESAHTGGILTLTKPTMDRSESGTYFLGLEGGTIFVMNDHGKTVSRYDLGASEVPFGVDPHTVETPSGVPSSHKLQV